MQDSQIPEAQSLREKTSSLVAIPEPQSQALGPMHESYAYLHGSTIHDLRRSCSLRFRFFYLVSFVVIKVCVMNRPESCRPAYAVVEPRLGFSDPENSGDSHPSRKSFDTTAQQHT